MSNSPFGSVQMHHLRELGFIDDPFSIFPDVPYMYFSSQLIPIWDYLKEMSFRSSGLALVTGDPGTGKTMLGKRLISYLRAQPRSYKVLDMDLSERIDSEYVFLTMISDELHLPRRKGVIPQWETILEELSRLRDKGISNVFIFDGVSLLDKSIIDRIFRISSTAGFVLILGGSEYTKLFDGLPSASKAAYKANLTNLGLTDLIRLISFRCQVAGRHVNFLSTQGASQLLSMTNGNPRLIVDHSSVLLRGIDSLDKCPLSANMIDDIISKAGYSDS